MCWTSWCCGCDCLHALWRVSGRGLHASRVFCLLVVVQMPACQLCACGCAGAAAADVRPLLVNLHTTQQHKLRVLLVIICVYIMRIHHHHVCISSYVCTSCVYHACAFERDDHIHVAGFSFVLPHVKVLTVTLLLHLRRASHRAMQARARTGWAAAGPPGVQVDASWISKTQ